MSLLLRKIQSYASSSWKKKMVSMDEELEQSYRVLPTDIDENLHMNHARYLAYMEAGRFEIMVRSGFLGFAIKHKLSAVVASANLVYRRSLLPFEPFRLKTKISRWTDQAFFCEQKFIKKNGDVAAIGLVDVRIIQSGKSLPLSEVVRNLGMEPGKNFEREDVVASQALSLAKALLKAGKEV